MKKGGYQIIDLENKSLKVGVGIEYPYIYDKIEGTTKPILLSGINIVGTELHDAFVEFKASGSSFVANAYGYVFTVADTDVLTVTNGG